MIKSVCRSAILPLMASVPFMSDVPAAFAADGDQTFFQSVRGEWSGPGEIVAGKYKGTKFTCSLTGDTPSGKVGMALEGSCRVGLFSQRMSARIERKGRSYKGTFLDGASGEGLDIVSGNVSKSKVVMSLNRNDLNGAMLASMKGDDTMSVTVSVRVNKELVPVIGMNLKRVDTAAVGAITRD